MTCSTGSVDVYAVLERELTRQFRIITWWTVVGQPPRKKKTCQFPSSSDYIIDVDRNSREGKGDPKIHQTFNFSSTATKIQSPSDTSSRRTIRIEPETSTAGRPVRFRNALRHGRDALR